MFISNKSVDNPINVALFTVMVIVIGLMAVKFLPIELFPELETPIIFVTIPYQGASPNEIEFQIIKKLEEELKGLEQIKKITSIAAQGVGTVIIEFDLNAKSDEKLTKVKDAVDRARPEMPKDIEEPVVQKFDFAKIPIMNVLIYGEQTKSVEPNNDSEKIKERLKYVELKDIAEKIKERFELVPFVSNVQIFGGLDREITIAVNPLSLWANNVSLNDIIKIFDKGNLDTPGGKITIGKKDFPIRVLGKYIDTNDIKKTVLTYKNGKPIYLETLGKIYEGTADVTSFARYNGKPAISLALIKEANSNLIKISDDIRSLIDEIKKSDMLPKGMGITVLGDQADEVRTRVKELLNSSGQGVIAVFLVLLFALGWRNALIASLGIPFAMLFAMIGLLIFGETINNLSQFGLILVVGIVVDGAIVVLENVYRYREMGYNKITSAKEGTEEVGSAVISSALTTMATFAPMLFMTGIVGKFMSVIPKTVIFALFGSILFDHIVIPVLCAKFLHVQDREKESLVKSTLIKYKIIPEDFHPFKKLFKLYQDLIRWSIGHRLSVVVITFLIFVCGLVLLLSLKREVFPELDLGKFWVEIELPRGSSVQASNDKSKIVEKILSKYLENKQNPNGLIHRYSASIGSSGVSTFGGAASGERKQGSNIARIDIDMIHESKRNISIDDFMAKIRIEILTQCVGAKYKITKPKSGPPTGAAVNVQFSGDDIRTLKTLAFKAKKLIKTIPGVTSLEDNYGLQRPEIQIPVNRFKAEKLGITVQEIQNYIFVLNNGYKVATYQYGEKDYEIRLKLDEQYKKSVSDLKNIPIYSNVLRKTIPITEVADVRLEGGLPFIQRVDLRRTIVVSGDVDRSLYTTAEVSNKVKEILTDKKLFSLSPGYTMRFRGESEDTAESFEGLKYAFIIGLMVVYFIIVIQLKSFIQPISIMLTVILSVVGIALGLLLSGSNLGIMSLFGGVSLAGIVVNDAIVLVSYLNILRAKGKTMVEAVVEAGETRLRAILLTTFTTAAGLLPLALALGGGRKFWTPMGWTIIGGLLVATFQTLIAVPVAYSILEDLKVKSKKLFRQMSLKAFIQWIKKLFKR